MVVLAGSIKFSFCLCSNQASSDAEDSMVVGEAGSNYASPPTPLLSIRENETIFPPIWVSGYSGFCQMLCSLSLLQIYVLLGNGTRR